MTLKEIKQYAKHLESLRNGRMPIWQELQEYLLPMRGKFDSTKKDKLKGAKNPNPMPLISLSRGAAGLTGAMTPASTNWFTLSFIDNEIEEISGARLYLEKLKESVSAALNLGGFYQAIHECNQELLAFGVFCMYIENSLERDFDGVYRTKPRYECCTCGSYAVGLDSFNNVQSLVRRFDYTLQQAKDRFGADKLSLESRNKLKTNPFSLLEIVHVVMRNENFNPQKMTKNTMPFTSYFFEANANDNADFLSIGGFLDMPYLFTSWSNTNGFYGPGLGDIALPDAKMLQALEVKELVGIDKTIDPPIRTPVGLRGNVGVMPGSQTPVNPYQESTIAPLYQINFMGGIQFVEGKIASVMRRIEETLLANTFADSFFDELKSGVTATAVLAARQQKVTLMSPILSSYEGVILSKAIFRTLNLLDMANSLPVMPLELQNFVSMPKDILKINYDSPLAQSIKTAAANATRQLTAEVGSLAGIDPTILDKLDFDQAIDVISKGIGASASVIRSDEQVTQIRQARVKQQADMQAEARQMQENQMLLQAVQTKTKDTALGQVMQN